MNLIREPVGIPHDSSQLHSALTPELGATDAARLAGLVEQMPPDGQINLATVLSALYPDRTEKEALAAFGQLRLAVKRAAGATGQSIALHVDTRKRDAPPTSVSTPTR